MRQPVRLTRPEPVAARYLARDRPVPQAQATHPLPQLLQLSLEPFRPGATERRGTVPFTRVTIPPGTGACCAGAIPLTGWPGQGGTWRL